MTRRPLRSIASRRILAGAILSTLAALLTFVAQFAVLVAPASAQFQVQIGAPPTPAEDEPFGVYLPTDRTLSRGVTRARERLNDGEYNEALAFLQQLLDRNEDVFVDDATDPNQLRGLKAAARQLISGLPSAGREMYELLHTAAARRELDAALAAGDRNALAQIVRRYLLTAPGCEAAFVLAQIELDRGHPLAAAHLYEQLLADPVAAKRFEPQLSLLSAVSWRAAGRLDTAATVLRKLAQDYPQSKIELAGRKVELPSSSASNSDLLAWLDDSVGTTHAVAAATTDWLTARGDAERNPQHSGGAPHLSARWLSRVVNDPRFENFLTARRELSQQQGLVAIPTARPIATGNVILMRTPQNVVAIDWQTGKRIWESREEESAAREQYLAEFTSGNNADELAAMSHPLEQRVWDDTLTMSLSSDSQRVYSLSGISLTERDDQSAWGIGPGFGSPYGAIASATNRLTAYELATEGKLAWEIDGTSAGGDLAGVFFLGAPLAVDGSLYVLAEIRSAIYLLALEPATGKLQWKQQLVGLEQGIPLDFQRRTSAVTPSYSAGVLICPTTAGIVVAVDAIRREFAWVYRYPRQIDSFIAGRPGFQNRQDIAFQRSNNRWLDGTALVADGKVIVTPPESTEIHCLELSSGKSVWKKQRDKSLFVACIDQGNVLLVGPDSVTALRLADSAAAWSKDAALPADALPSGLGYLSEGQYYLPLTDGRVIAINTSDGTTTNATKASSESVAGNLICHRGSIISQSALFLEKFEQIEVLRERAKAALAANPRDAAAIRDLAEMRRLEGALGEAVPMLKQAYEIDPANMLTREMLADTLLEALANDYLAHRNDLPLLRNIVDRPPQQIELLRIEAQGLAAAGERLGAFAAYLRLIDATSVDLTTLAIRASHTARSDNWIRAQLAALWKSATDSEREEIARQLAERRKSWADPPTAGDVRSYLAYFGGLSETDSLRSQLAQKLVKDAEPLEAELELLRLGRSPSETARGSSAVLFTQWLLDQGRGKEAALAAKSVSSNWSSSPSVEGKTPAEWLKEWQTQLAESNADNQPWPRGRATASDLPPAAANRRDVTRRAQAEIQLGLRRLRVEQMSEPVLGPTQWLISQDGSRLIGRDAAGQDVFRFNASRRSMLRRPSGNADLVQAAQLGDILYFTLGGQVVALDTRQRGENNDSDIVWQSNPSGRLPIVIRGNRTSGRSIYHAASLRHRIAGAAGAMFASLGPATPFGVVYQDQQRLRAVDPLTGETLWSRSDIPPGCELFGDDEFVLAADVDEAKLYVLRMSDGELIDERPLPEIPWLLTAGRNIAQLADGKNGQTGRKSLRILDAVSGKLLLEIDCDPAVRLTTLEPNFVALVEPGGIFQLIDVRTHAVLIDQKLLLDAAPRSIALYRAGDYLYLGVSGAARQQSSRPIGLDYPLVDGQLFAFDIRDGQSIWPGPAVIDSRGLALSQPTDIPVLVFVDRLLKRDASGSNTRLRLLCIDRETGATVYRNDDLPDISGGHMRIRTTRSDTQSIDFEMTAKTVRLAFTDAPRSPEPPTNDLVEAPRKSLGRGLWGVGRRMGSVLQDVLKSSGRSAGGAGDDNQAFGGEDALDDD